MASTDAVAARLMNLSSMLLMRRILLPLFCCSSLALGQHGVDNGAAASLRVFRDGLGIVSVQRTPGMPVLLAIDFVTGRTGALMPASGDTSVMTYIEGGAQQRSPQRFILGAGNTAVLDEPNRPRRVVTDIGVRSEDVTFANDDVVLSGQLILPAGPGPHPAVIFLHGSGGASRAFFVSIGGYLAAHGIASLAYDKRGSGRSTGNWQLSTLKDLAADARAGVRLLRQHPEIDARRIGLYGTSQGPWLSEIIASEDPTIRLIMSSSGGGVGGREQELYRRTTVVRDSGYAAADVEMARAAVTRFFAYLASGGADTAGVDETWRTISGKPWVKLILPVENPRLSAWSEARKVFAKDLATDAELPARQRRIKAPVLMIFASGDQNVPPARAIEAMRKNLPRHGDQLTSVILKDADHKFQVKAAPGDIPVTHPDYYPTILNWLMKNFGMKRQ